MFGLPQDLRFALRMLRRSPGYAAVSVGTLALAIGATTALYSVIDGVLLRPLPYRDPERLVVIWEKAPSFPEMSVSYPDFLDWRKAQSSFEELGALRVRSFNLTGTGRAERIEGRMMTQTMLPLLGVQPALGRNFTAEEDAPGGPPVALLTWGFWQRSFGRDPRVVGRTIGLDGTSYTVVGVLPRSFHADTFRYPIVDGDVYVPLGRIDPLMNRRGSHPGIFATGRLKPGVTLAQARADLESIGRALGEKYESNRVVLPALAPLRSDRVREVRAPLLTLFGAVGFVLLIAVANVANLMLARGSARRRELAIRAALGAGRLRIVRQLLVESALLALVGGAVGVLLALWGVDLLTSARADSLPGGAAINVDGRVLAFSLVISLLTGLLFGLAPALTAASENLHDSLKQADVRTAQGEKQHRLRSLLVVVEVALSLVLLVGAGLSLRGFLRLRKVDPGFRPQQLATAALAIPPQHFPSAPARRAFFEQLAARMAVLPGVATAGLSAGLPLAGSSETSFCTDSQPRPQSGAEVPFAVYYPVTPGYFDALGIGLLGGRRFSAHDTLASAPVTIIDEVLARRLYPGQDPIGRHLENCNGENPREIVGVVRHVANYGLDGPEPAPYQFYLPLAQLPDDVLANYTGGINLAVRSPRPLSQLAPELAATVATLDRDLPLYDVKPMSQLVSEALGDRRFAMTLLGLFAALALTLATVGLYAVMSYLVTQRTHEIGIRMALGARAADVRRLVVGHGLRLAAIGLLCGALAALALGRVMSALLSGVRPTDPLTFATVVALLASAAALASFVPARRATRVDPMIALRSE